MPGRTPPSRPARGRLPRPQTPLTEEREPARRTPLPETPQAGGTRDPTSLRPVDRSSRGHRGGGTLYTRYNSPSERWHPRPIRRKTLRILKGWSRSANGPASTSAGSARRRERQPGPPWSWTPRVGYSRQRGRRSGERLGGEQPRPPPRQRHG